MAKLLCPKCKREMPEVTAGGDQVRMIVCPDHGEQPALIKRDPC